MCHVYTASRCRHRYAKFAKQKLLATTSLLKGEQVGVCSFRKEGCYCDSSDSLCLAQEAGASTTCWRAIFVATTERAPDLSTALPCPWKLQTSGGACRSSTLKGVMVTPKTKLQR